MPPAYVKPYVKRNKNDAADAEVICEAVTRPSMRFVAIKKDEQPGMLMLHRTRELLVRQRTMLVNAIRGHRPSLGWSPGPACRMSRRCSPRSPIRKLSSSLVQHRTSLAS